MFFAEEEKTRGHGDKERRHAEQLAAIERARRKFNEDTVYRALHTAVALLFAEQLRRDLADLHAGKMVSSLAAKWAPTPKGEHASSPECRCLHVIAFTAM